MENDASSVEEVIHVRKKTRKQKKTRHETTYYTGAGAQPDAGKYETATYSHYSGPITATTAPGLSVDPTQQNKCDGRFLTLERSP